MFREVPTVVAIQRSLGDGKFVNLVCEVQLENLKREQGAFILKSLRLIDRPYKRGLPFLHKGYFDSHLHVSGMGWSQEIVALGDCSNPAAVVQKLSSAVPNSRGFVEAFGWNEGAWKLGSHAVESVFHTRLPEHAPLYAKRICTHSALINDHFKRWIGLPHLPTFVTDKDLALIESRLPRPDLALVQKWILRGQDQLLSHGITAVGDMSLDQTHVDAFRNIANEGLLKVDFQGVVDAGRAPTHESLGPQCLKNFNDWGPLGRPAELQLRHWKKYLDGSFGSRTAWLSQMYADQETFGDALENFEDLFRRSSEALKKGFYLSFHAIGDAALDLALRLGEKLGPELGQHASLSHDPEMLPSTHRLEHVQLIRADQMERLRRQNFWTLCLQPHHRLADADFIRQRLGHRYHSEAYRLGSLAAAQIPFTLGSDAPVDDFSPLAVLHSCLIDDRGVENLTFEEALWNYTTGARLRLGLRPGLLAENATVFLTPSL